MREYSLDCTLDVGSAELASGTWLVLLRADRIPHVALLQDGTCYSLEHDGNQRYPHEKLWRLIESRRTPALLCQLAAPGAPAAPFFAAFDRLEGEANCFTPVRDFCASWFEPAAACEYPYELVALLAESGRITRAGSFHLPLDAGRRFRLPVYDKDDIRARIDEVRRDAER